jgi:hypothetical protein
LDGGGVAQRAPWRGYIALVVAVPLLLPFAGPIPPEIASALTFSDLQPDGGEVLTADTTIPIAWNATHDADPWFWATLSYAADGGAGGFITRGDFPLAPGTAVRLRTTGSFTWTPRVVGRA